MAERKAQNIPDHEHMYLVEVENPPSPVPRDGEGHEEENTYDRDIVTEEDIAWTKAFYARSRSARTRMKRISPSGKINGSQS